MRAVKQLLAGHAATRLDEEIEDAIAANALQRSTEDFREGVRAFLEHRRPEWPKQRHPLLCAICGRHGQTPPGPR